MLYINWLAALTVPCKLEMVTKTPVKVSKQFFGGEVFKIKTGKYLLNFHISPEQQQIAREQSGDINKLQRGVHRVVGALARGNNSEELYVPVMPQETISEEYIGPNGPISYDELKKYLPPKKEVEGQRWHVFKVSSIKSMKLV